MEENSNNLRLFKIIGFIIYFVIFLVGLFTFVVGKNLFVTIIYLAIFLSPLIFRKMIKLYLIGVALIGLSFLFAYLSGEGGLFFLLFGAIPLLIIFGIIIPIGYFIRWLYLKYKK